ncbi:MAG: lipopolysaccharide heptosyltransferase II [Candidatus Tritonobacter lacicola]|nr:lipopolysaccharide heptosyltransferase II [Candidatus Tritonobacter lacicola]
MKSIPDISAIQKVVIRVPNWIGDTVMAVPAVMALRDILGDAELTVLARAPLSLLWAHNPAVDSVFGLAGKGVREEAAFLKAGGYDLTVLLTNSFGTALSAWLAGVPVRLGYTCHGRRMLLNRGVRRDARVRSMHQAEQYLNLVGHLGAIEGEKDARVWAGRKAGREADSMLRESGYEEGGLTVGLCPGAAYGPAKRWPAGRFTELANALVRKKGAQIVIFTGGEEVELAADVARGIFGRKINLGGRTDLLVLAAAMKRCDVVVSNDTGTMHLASASGVPVVGIFGSTEPARTSPLGKHAIVRSRVHCSPCFRRTCRKGLNYECMEKITVEEVYKATVGLITK